MSCFALAASRAKVKKVNTIENSAVAKHSIIAICEEIFLYLGATQTWPYSYQLKVDMGSQ